MAVLTAEPKATLSASPGPRASRESLRRFLLGFCGGGIVVLLAILCLPHDPAVRFHLLNETDYLKMGWIYDRLHLSPTPVDVAVIGTSHTMNGVDSDILERALSAASGAADGRQVHVANLAVPHLGDDLHELIARMLLATKQPRLVVIETHQLEARAAHPMFAEVADISALAKDPWGNMEVLADLARLPRRQVRYFLEGLADRPAPAGVDDHWNDTYQAVFHGNIKGSPRTTPMAPDRVIQEAADERSRLNEKADAYRGAWGWLLWYYNETHLRRMLDAIKERNVPILFLYLPVFGTQEPPAAAALLERYGKILTPPRDILDDPTLWADKEHLSYDGARRLTGWLAEALMIETQWQK